MSSPAFSRPVVLGGLVVVGGVLLLAATQNWVTASGGLEGLPTVTVDATGRTVAPLVPGAGLVALGAAAAALLAGRVGRLVVGALVIVVGALAAVEAAAVRADPAGAIASELESAAGITDVPLQTATVSLWALVGVGGSIVLVVLGLVLAIAGWRSGPGWGASGRRYRRNDAATESGSAPPPAGGATQAGTTSGGIGLWDALERGEDPTDR